MLCRHSLPKQEQVCYLIRKMTIKKTYIYQLILKYKTNEPKLLYLVKLVQKDSQNLGFYCEGGGHGKVTWKSDVLKVTLLSITKNHTRGWQIDSTVNSIATPPPRYWVILVQQALAYSAVKQHVLWFRDRHMHISCLQKTQYQNAGKSERCLFLLC